MMTAITPLPALPTIVRRDYKCNKHPCTDRNGHRSRMRLPDLDTYSVSVGGRSPRGAVTVISGQVLATSGSSMIGTGTG